MITQHEEDATFRECMDYLNQQDIPHDIRCAVAKYFGRYGVQAWTRGLRQGVEARHGTDV